MQLSLAIARAYCQITVVISKKNWMILIEISGNKGSVDLFFFLQHRFCLVFFYFQKLLMVNVNVQIGKKVH